jgi:hypothetical protein
LSLAAAVVGILLLSTPVLAVDYWQYMRRVGANNSNPGCGAGNPVWCQDAGQYWAGYDVNYYSQYGEYFRAIYAGTRGDDPYDNGLFWSSTSGKVYYVNYNIQWYGACPAINLDEKGWDGNFQTGLDGSWISSSLPNPVPQRNDDNGDGLKEEVRVWARNASIAPNTRYRAYAEFIDQDATYVTHRGQINYSAYEVSCNFGYNMDTRWLGKFYFTSTMNPSFQCGPNASDPCVQSP